MSKPSNHKNHNEQKTNAKMMTLTCLGLQKSKENLGIRNIVQRFYNSFAFFCFIQKLIFHYFPEKLFQNLHDHRNPAMWRLIWGFTGLILLQHSLHCPEFDNLEQLLLLAKHQHLDIASSLDPGHDLALCDACDVYLFPCLALEKTCPDLDLSSF